MFPLNASGSGPGTQPWLPGLARAGYAKTGAAFLFLTLTLLGRGQVGQAHQVQIAADVGGTLHIEPNDTPRAQAESQLWFALNRQGGKVIPLSACDCSLRIYSATNGATPIAQPPLQPVSAEGYSDIPGATVVFPEVGAYTVVIAGSPMGQVEFTPFELTYPVTVAAAASPPLAPEVQGKSASQPPATPALIETPLPQPRQGPPVWPFGLGGLGIGLLLWRGWQRSQAKQQ